MSDLLHATATGDVVPTTHSGQVRSVTLTPAAALATATVRINGAAGTIKLVLQAAASGASVVWVAGDAEAGVLFDKGVHVTLTGAGATVDVEVSQN